MQSLPQSLRALSLDLASAGSEPSFLAEVSDHALVSAVAIAIERPKADRFSSFLLHAPLELLARAALLPMVAPRHRSAARMRIAQIAVCYADGDELEVPTRMIASVPVAWSMLTTALREGDADTADAAIVHLSERLSIGALCVGLVDQIAPCLGAAAHAPLLLAAQIDAQPRLHSLPYMLRPATRMLAASAGQRLSWIDTKREETGPADLWAALAEPPHVALDTDFIAPTMLAVEADGMAAGLLTRATGSAGCEVARSLMNIAAVAMIQEGSRHLPYGWTHCLTLPQGLLALRHYSADPERLARIAATYVLGFRATLGAARLDPDRPLPTVQSIFEHVDYAALHGDAHLAKYVAACMAASAADPANSHLFAAAVDRLTNYWKER